MPDRKIKVLIVDDSALMRQLLTQILTSDPEIEVVGTAVDPLFAMEKIPVLRPDVLTLDVEMPRMDGLTFLKQLMEKDPLPVVMVSTLTVEGGEITLRALELGAVDFFPKPTLRVLARRGNELHQIIEKVKTAARARLQPQFGPATAPPVVTPRSGAPRTERATRIIAIGASTGGTEAIRHVLTSLPEDTPGIVIVQHMPPGFTASFARRLDSLCAINVREAQNGDRVVPGTALIAPGDFQMQLVRSRGEYSVHVFAGEPVNRHRPSVDVLFHSVAEQAGPNAVAALLTGMGADGARGMRRMRDAGAYTIAQDEATCVVFGMPREAIAQGGACNVLPLDRIGPELYRVATGGQEARAA